MYDHQSRYVVSSKYILSPVFQSVIPEFKDMKTEDIMNYIENNLLIHQVGVYIGELIDGKSNETIDFNDGKNVMDIVTDIYIPFNNDLEKRIVNVELQNKVSYGYAMQAREMLYGSRLLLMQYGREFDGMDYSQIKRVYTIWIMTNPPKYRVNTISKVQMAKTYRAMLKETQ